MEMIDQVFIYIDVYFDHIIALHKNSNMMQVLYSFVGIYFLASL